MLTRHLTTKILDIRLEEEKFYFPGETIKGEIIVHPKSTIKINCINLKFHGEVYIHLKEKETNTLFQDLLVLPSPKQTTLDSGVDHAFPFEFIVPKHLNLPSSMEFGKKGHIRYTITAMLDRPMLLESLCPKVDYVVSLLEYIDIEREQFKIPQEKSQDLMLPQAKYNQKCMARASMPRLGFTRGDIVPLKVKIDHFTSYSRKDGVTVELVRTVEIRTSRHTVFKESVLRKTPYLLEIKSPGFNQSILCQLLIPTSTPPSLRYKDKVLRFHYKVRVTVHFGDGSSSQIILDMPIVVGTWPRASVPIEDDDDDTLDMEDSVKGEDEEEEVTDDTDIESLRTCSIDDSGSRRSSSGWNNASNMTLNGNINRNSSSISADNNAVGRSDSVASKASNRSFNSISSFKSSRSWDQQSQQQQYYQYHQYNHSANNLSRNISSSSAKNQHHQSHRRSSSIYSNDSSTLYPNSVTSSSNNINRHSVGSVASNGSVSSMQQQQQQQHYNRQLPPTMVPGVVIGYGGYGNGGYSNNNNNNRLSRYSNRHEDDPPVTPTSVLLESDVPTHILEPISSPTTTNSNTGATGGFVPLTSPIHELQESDYYTNTTQATTLSCNESLSSLSPSEDEDEDDSDEDDLLAIIERKKKKERRDLKKKRIAEKAATSGAPIVETE